MRIREATDDDWSGLYSIFTAITAEGRTYAYPQDATSDQARSLWMGQGRVVVAEEEGRVLATATMGANRGGRGAHVATASFMVDPAAQGRGIGRALGEHVVDWATSSGFRGIQFNAVVQTNDAAVHLWRSVGFAVIGTVPGAFDHPEHGYVGLHVMYRPLP